MEDIFKSFSYYALKTKLYDIKSKFAFRACEIPPDLFDDWCKEMGKTYSTEEEKQYRRRVLEDSCRRIARYKGGPDGFTCKLEHLNCFADLSYREYVKIYCRGIDVREYVLPEEGASGEALLEWLKEQERIEIMEDLEGWGVVP